MKLLLEFRLPDEVLAKLPETKAGAEEFLAKFFDEDINYYEQLLRRQAGVPFNGALTRFERATIKDYLMRRFFGDQEEMASPEFRAEPMSAAR
jgi:hypothetical protein